jgi:hypothetical protein
MNAIDLIQQVAALPPQERTLFERLFRTLDQGKFTPPSPSNPEWPDFGERLRGIYGDKVAPDSQNIIDEGRGTQ